MSSYSAKHWLPHKNILYLHRYKLANVLTKLHSFKVLSIGIFLGLTQLLLAQDKIYKSSKSVIVAKVFSVGPTLVRYRHSGIVDGPDYGIYIKEVDSIVYANGLVDNLIELYPRVNYKENIKLLNTWSFNTLGFINLSICQSYERRLKNGIIGFRIPLYIGFSQNIIAGLSVFEPGWGGFNNPVSFNSTGAFNMAVGFNPKFYVNRHRVIRLFAGPEADIGFSIYRYTSSNSYYYTNYAYELHKVGSFSALGVVGLSINPKERFNLTVHGGAGAGNIFGVKTKDAGWIGVWQIGASLGTNF